MSLFSTALGFGLGGVPGAVIGAVGGDQILGAAGKAAGGFQDFLSGGNATYLPNTTGVSLNYDETIRNRLAQQNPEINTLPQEWFRNAQMDLTSQLQNTAAGRGPSLAEAQLKQAQDQNLQAQMAQAASARGVNAGLGARLAAQNMAAGNQQASAQAVQARLAEQIAAQQQLAGVTNQGRGQDIGLATNQSGLSLQSQQSKDEFLKSLLGLANQRDIAQGQLSEAGKSRIQGGNKAVLDTVGKVGGAVATMGA